VGTIGRGLFIASYLNDPVLNRLYIDHYLQFKISQSGYTDLENQRKREALENISTCTPGLNSSRKSNASAIESDINGPESAITSLIIMQPYLKYLKYRQTFF
jgi:hypothetical protein